MNENWKWWHWLLPWKWPSRKRTGSRADPNLESPTSPLREFVYLDEVSIKSLLVSQKGELTAEFTDQVSLADQAEITGKLSAGPKNIGAELGSRYQATSTFGRQTLRKSIAQSQFKELFELDSIEIRFGENGTQPTPESYDELIGNGRYALPASQLCRGDLIEVEVELDADPIYRFNLTISELADLAEKYPEMTEAPGAAEVLSQIGPINRMLEQLLVRLVPIRARCLNLGLVEHDGQTHVVDTSITRRLGIPAQSLDIVGVTDLDQYWKDVRRVLFSQSSYKMLCRIARAGVHSTWSPVKGAEVLSELIPQFPGLLDTVGSTNIAASPDNRDDLQQSSLVKALRTFVDLHTAASAQTLTREGRDRCNSLIDEQRGNAMTATGQRIAFDELASFLKDELDFFPSPEQIQEFRQRARDMAGLKFSTTQIPIPTKATLKTREDSNLLDVEVIAIYW